jgi:hypothetical protein
MLRSGAPLPNRCPQPCAERRPLATARRRGPRPPSSRIACSGGGVRTARPVLLLALSVSLAASAAATAPLNASIDTPRIAPVIAGCEAGAPSRLTRYVIVPTVSRAPRTEGAEQLALAHCLHGSVTRT